MTIKQQIKAIKDCLHSEYWDKVSVKHLWTNQYNRSIKYYEVKWGKDEYVFVITITVTDMGIMDLKSKGLVFLDTIKALDKALGGK